jgi:serine/threonine-protein kinase ULK4
MQVNPSYVRDIEGMGLAPQFFDFLSLEHANNNVHNIRLCRQVIANGRLPVASLLDMQVAEKVAAVLEYATQNNVEPFLEPVLELSHTLVQRDVQELEAGGQQGGSLTVLFMDQAATFLELCAHADGSVSRAAAACVLDLITVFPQQVAPWILSAESVAVVVNVLQGEHLGPGAPVPPQLQQLMLEALAQAVEEPGAVGNAVSPELAQLYDTSRALAASGDASVRPAATQLAGQLAQFVAQ